MNLLWKDESHTVEGNLFLVLKSERKQVWGSDLRSLLSLQSCLLPLDFSYEVYNLNNNNRISTLYI